VTTVCIGLRERTGGVMEVTECLKWVNKLRGPHKVIPIEDLYEALESLQVLGQGMTLLEPSPGQKFIVSVPLELNQDQALVLQQGAQTGYVQVDMFPSWTFPRFQQALDALVSQGIVWVDYQETPFKYWFPSHSLFK